MRRRKRKCSAEINMEFPTPSVRPEPHGSQTLELPTGNFGVPDHMLHGFQNVREQTKSVHPLEYSEKHWNENKARLDLAMLRNTQGIHAPLKLQMEKMVASKMHRLPGMASSNIMMDTLTGRDGIIDFDDVLGNAQDSEVMGDTHVLMEKRLNIL